jgi:hypothetical protein
MTSEADRIHIIDEKTEMEENAGLALDEETTEAPGPG